MPQIVYLLLTIPTVTALIGWITNWAAVKMIFYPEKYIGIGPIGWQGILTKQAHKFAQNVANMVTENFLTAEQMVGSVDPQQVEQLMAGDHFDENTKKLVEECGEIVAPGAWPNLPQPMQAMVLAQIKVKTAEMIRLVFDKVKPLLVKALDLHKIIIGSLTGENVQVMVRLTKYIGRKEFKFIEYYGGVFGAIIGLAQVALWSIMQKWWLMPIVGAIVGLVTNWLAIQMIFRPKEPTRYLGLVTYQGLFPKRQAQIAQDYGVIAAREILTPPRLIDFIMQSEAGQKLGLAVVEAISERIDAEWEQAKAMMPVEVTEEQLAKIKAKIVESMLTTLPEIRPELERYLDEVLEVRANIEDKMAALDKDRFERILRGIFEEDEIILILVGGVLGAGVGFLQALLVLAVQ